MGIGMVNGIAFVNSTGTGMVGITLIVCITSSVLEWSIILFAQAVLVSLGRWYFLRSNIGIRIVKNIVFVSSICIGILDRIACVRSVGIGMGDNISRECSIGIVVVDSLTCQAV